MRSGKIFLSLANSLIGTNRWVIKSINPGSGEWEAQIGKGLRPFFISRPKEQGGEVWGTERSVA
jgi:hypothetical protein